MHINLLHNGALHYDGIYGYVCRLSLVNILLIKQLQIHQYTHVKGDYFGVLEIGLGAVGDGCC